jgi:hypothetical protein
MICAALLTLPSTASAQQATALHFNTAITQVYGSPYPLTGKLDLQIFGDGHIRGYYHTSFYKLFIPVVGGRDSDYVWLDIGPSSIDLGLGAGPEGRLHVVGTMNGDGSFRGQVYPVQAAVLSGVSPVSGFANPGPGPTPDDQYIFTATPAQEGAPTPAP